mgnify:CR=1 FL=1
MTQKDREKWDSKYGSSEHITGTQPSKWLTENTELLLGHGKALDLAMGEGRNAVYLASLGFETLGVDISSVGTEKARKLAYTKNVNISIEIADLDHYEPEKNYFDLIVCFNFLDRGFFRRIQDALKAGGLLFYETFNSDHLKYSEFKKEWVLKRGELLTEFSNFQTLRYREMNNGQKGFTSYVGKKPI